MAFPFRLILLLSCLLFTARALAPVKTSPPASVLRRAVDPSNAPSLLELTKALVELSRSTNPETNWSQKLGAKSWTPVFSASPEVLQNTHNDTAVGRFLPPGISCLSFSSSTNETGTACNQINPFFGGSRAATFRVEGTYTLNDRTMTLEFEQLTIRLLVGWNHHTAIAGYTRRTRHPKSVGTIGTRGKENCGKEENL
ncbi:expressed unknown protein [Seminavis robusta]|uniref:Uncharacterized protein n=1 Tax=Seminavis robusta TaxID=568900 RepID=A0A9N8F2Z9_9STRA|nr:expressed unknown protein [Seminavis robusta]|eukprot:Sro2935_g340580.1 n/a (198) ;mRNA; r:7952-8545